MLVACTEMMRLLCSATQKKTKEDFNTTQQVNIMVASYIVSSYMLLDFGKLMISLQQTVANNYSSA